MERFLTTATEAILSATALVALPLFLMLLASGCGDDARGCPSSQCNEAWCDGETVVWCKCGFDGDGGLSSALLRSDCAADGMTCAVASDGADGGLREAVCNDACTERDATTCRDGADGSVVYVCGDYVAPNRPRDDNCASCPDPGAPHDDETDREHDASVYSELMSWQPSADTCVP